MSIAEHFGRNPDWKLGSLLSQTPTRKQKHQEKRTNRWLHGGDTSFREQLDGWEIQDRRWRDRFLELRQPRGRQFLPASLRPCSSTPKDRAADGIKKRYPLETRRSMLRASG